MSDCGSDGVLLGIAASWHTSRQLYTIVILELPWPFSHSGRITGCAEIGENGLQNVSATIRSQEIGTGLMQASRA